MQQTQHKIIDKTFVIKSSLRDISYRVIKASNHKVIESQSHRVIKSLNHKATYSEKQTLDKYLSACNHSNIICRLIIYIILTVTSNGFFLGSCHSKRMICSLRLQFFNVLSFTLYTYYIIYYSHRLAHNIGSRQVMCCHQI